MYQYSLIAFLEVFKLVAQEVAFSTPILRLIEEHYGHADLQHLQLWLYRSVPLLQ